MTAYLFFVRLAKFSNRAWITCLLLGFVIVALFDAGIVAYWLFCGFGFWFPIWLIAFVLAKLCAPPTREELNELGVIPKSEPPKNSN
jgi:hypothetical protein